VAQPDLAGLDVNGEADGAALAAAGVEWSSIRLIHNGFHRSLVDFVHYLHHS
jgi:hypothetical protein